MERATRDPTIDPNERPEAPKPPISPFQRLLHRWFIEYNPLYLVSALLVLGGLSVISRSTAESSSTAVQIGAVAAIAEIYAFALIAGAALLTRIGMRRPAVMLGLITALYQCDLTLLTERQVYLGLASALAVAAWLALFVIKLHALAWALRLRLSRSAVAVPAFGALGMAILPHVLQHGHDATKSIVVSMWVFALFAGGLWSTREVTSLVDLDAWGRTVLARSLKATWMLWGALVSMHVLFWCHESGASPAALLPAALLLATRGMRREITVWGAAAGALLFAGVEQPRTLWGVSLLVAVTLALRALRQPAMIEHDAAAPETTPYRAATADAPPATVSFGFTRSDRASMWRLLSGSIVAVYLSAWTFGWSGDELPPHALLLDASLVAVAALMLWRARTRAILAPVALTWLHAGAQAGIITAPASALQWGIASVGSGFVLLLGSLVIAWRLRATTEIAADSPVAERHRTCVRSG